MPRSKTLMGVTFQYDGSLNTGIVVHKEIDISINTKIIQIIKDEIIKKRQVLMGACHDNPTPNSIGETLLTHGYSPQNLSYIIPLLVEEGFCSTNGRKPFTIKFGGGALEQRADRPSMSAFKTIQRMEERVGQLITEFSECLNIFDGAQLFTGPSLYFHYKTLRIRGKYSTAVDTLNDEDFYDSLYATLTAWGMHRMGTGNAKLAELDEIKESFRQQVEQIREVEAYAISELEKSRVGQVAEQLWRIISGLKIGIGETKIVANSKALHHLLPSLIPPVDREHTIRFFYHHKTLNQGDENAFREIYPYFHQIATSCKGEIQQRVTARHGMDTSETKVIDNAIVGYVRKYLPKKKKTSDSER